MRSALLSLVVLAGCPKAGDGAADAVPPVARPDLDCPAATEPRGAAPPDGLEVYCVRLTPRGEEERHGPSIAWHDATTRAAEGAFYANARHGPWTEWSPAGHLRLEAQYVHGVPDGPWAEYHPNGTLKARGTMAAGEPDGHWTYWTERGRLAREGSWAAGVPDGLWVYYGPDERPTARRTYRDGRLISQTEL